MNRPVVWKLGCCLVWIGSIAASDKSLAGGRNGMKMHVFAERDDDTALTVKAGDRNGAPVDLKMVVFDGGGGGSAGVRRVQASDRSVTGQPAGDLEEYPRHQPQDTGMTVRSYGEVGYRNDELKWNIAGQGGAPNVLSELQWYNVHSAVVTAGTDITIDTNWQVDGKISYGQVVEGQNQDSDYFLNDRQAEFSRSNNVADDGMSIDLSADVGYHLTLGNPRRAPYWRFTPKAGYAFHSQQFTMTEGMQTVSAYGFPMPLGSFSGLHSTYEGTWFGPWGGLSTQLALTERFSLDASIEYHWIDYEGSGNWNLRGEFQHPKSFTQEAAGEGIVLSAVARYLITPDWILRLSVQYQDWQANDNGRDKTYFTNDFVGESPFNEVKWKSYGLNLGVEYAF